MRKRWVTPSFEASELTSATKRVKNNNQPLSTKKDYVSCDFKSSRKSWTILEKYAPDSINDLVIHRKKIEEVETWMRGQLVKNGNDRKYLLLCGPSGCGKSTTLRVVAKSMNINIIEWITPLDRDKFPFTGIESCSDNTSIHHRNNESSAESFDQFLWNASRYGSLMFPSFGKLILIKDFPNFSIQNSESFHNLLEKYYNLRTCSIVFICNDDTVCRTVFPERIRNKCAIQSIVFNPINFTAFMKALKRVIELERQTNRLFLTPSDSDLKILYEESAGDLRSALLKLQFSTITPPLFEEKCNNNTMTGVRLIPSSSINAARKDQVIDLFKLLGRVLYSKRMCKHSDVNRNEEHISHCHRYEFSYNPDEIAKTVSIQPSLFAAFLQENYPSRFSDVNAIASAADNLSLADIMLKYYDVQTEMIALNIVIRGLMVPNFKPRKIFTGFTKPQSHSNADKISADRTRNLICKLFPELQSYLSKDFIMYALPLIRRHPSFNFNDSQLEFINKIHSFSDCNRE